MIEDKWAQKSFHSTLDTITLNFAVSVKHNSAYNIVSEHTTFRASLGIQGS